jgi:hypothetical protein
VKFQIKYRVRRTLEVHEHLADEDAPAATRVSVLDFGQPALDGGFVLLAVQQQFGGVASLHVLQHSDPVFHGGDRVGGQVVRLFACRDLKGRSAVGTGHPTQVVQLNLTLWFPACIALVKQQRQSRIS